MSQKELTINFILLYADNSVIFYLWLVEKTCCCICSFNQVVLWPLTAIADCSVGTTIVQHLTPVWTAYNTRTVAPTFRRLSASSNTRSSLPQQVIGCLQCDKSHVSECDYHILLQFADVRSQRTLSLVLQVIERISQMSSSSFLTACQTWT